MPVQVSYPGVYVQEVASGSRTITGVSTSVALFLGKTRRGRLGVPTRVLSLAEYERQFGLDTTIGETTDQVRQFFLNGGQQAWIVRLAGVGYQAATARLRDAGGSTVVLEVLARDVGIDGNGLRVAADYATSNPESTFNLRVFREGVTPAGQVTVLAEERFEGLSMNPADPRFVERVVNQGSQLVDVKVPDDVRTDAGSLPAGLRRFNGFSMSGLAFTTAATADEVRAAINNLIAPASQPARNRIQIKVDTSPFVTVTLPSISSLAFDTTITAWKAAIEDALRPHGNYLVDVQVRHHASVGRFLRVSSAASAAGGDVVVKPAPASDAAIPLQLGVDQGGLEAGGFARQRPAPAGLFASLGDLGTSTPANTLLKLGAQTGAAVATWQLVDANGTRSASTGFAAADALFKGAAYTPPLAAVLGSLLNLRANLRQLGQAIVAAQPAGQKWTATLQGHRLVLVPTYGDVDADASGRLTSTGSGGYDIGASGEVFGTANARGLRLGDTRAASAFREPGLAGADGGAVPATTYDAAYVTVERVVDVFNLMLLPRSADQTDDDRANLWGAASAFAQRQRAFLLVDPRADWTSIEAVSQGIGNLRIGLVKDHAAVYWPRVLVSRGAVSVPIDPSGAVAGLMARVDSNRGVWKAPAGVEADLRGVRGVERAMSDPDNGVLNPLAVNAIRAFPNGIVAWGARTVDGFDNSGNDDYKYVSVRRLALLIEESLERGLKFAVFEPNDEPLWAQVRLAAGGFMNNLFRQGAFAGQKASDAYFVKCDAETTTQNDINLGVVNVIVGFAALKPAEFVVVTIKQKAGQVQV
jgi:phage tail sheath protein FI